MNFCPKARRIIVDIDPAELGKLKMTIDVAACLDVKIFLEELALRIKGPGQDLSLWLERCRQWKGRYPVMLPGYREVSAAGVNTYALVDVIAELLSGDDLVVPGSSGACSEITMQAFKVKAGQRVFNDPGLGAMGYGLPASMGACIASGRKRTVTLIGDGGLQHNIQELQTIARLKLPLKIFILNNNGYASIRNTQKAHFKGHLVACDPSSGLTLPDTCAVAAAYGLGHGRILGTDDLRARVAEVLVSDGPFVCDVMIDPALITAPRLQSEVRPDGTIVSKPMEDLWPFLERKEFEENMKISLDEGKG